MKLRYIMMAGLLSMTAIAQAQDTYLNDRVTATDDVIGTSRYVGMGGAMGALGADMSVISSSPAGMGLYRKSDIALTAGAIIPNGNGWDNDVMGENKAHGTFDQMGLVWSNNIGGRKLKFLNLGFNYQKKANYNQAFYADNANLNGLSQMDQLAELATMGYDTDYNLAGAAVDYGYLSKDDQGYYNEYSGENSKYSRHMTGSAQSFDFNISFNVNDRVYTGLTIGADNVDYRSWSLYEENNATTTGNIGDYQLYNDRRVDGAGVNIKWGIIVRPIETSSFRIGLTAETPTWYRMKSSTLYQLDQNNVDEAYMEYNVTTPWKVRLAMGSTVGNKFAWGAEYEYANAAKTKMGYSDYGWYQSGYSIGNGESDKAMNQYTSNTLKGQHTIKLGIEVKPIDPVALRLGYNFVSSRYKDDARLDQYNIDSKAMDFSTSTDYMNLSATNILTAGIGYKYKKFYVDLAYKCRIQSGDFYAFDTSFTQSGSQFANDNPNLANATINPVDVNLNRHQVTATVGFKF